jgi:hypothetical protein
MPISPVVARIDVVVSGQQQLDRLANSYLSVQRAATTASQSVQRMAASHAMLSGGVGGLFQGFNRLTAQLANHANQVNAAGRAASSFHGNILRLTQSMVLFSVLLPLVRLPQTALRSFQEFIQVGSDWEHQVRGISALLGGLPDQYQALDSGLKQLKNTYALTNEEVGQTVKQIATTLDVLQRNQAGMTAAERAQDDLNTTMRVSADIAKLSRAAYADMGDVSQAAFTILSTGRLGIDQLDGAMDTLFKTVQVGRTTFAQFNSAAQRFLPFWEEWIQTASTAEQRQTRLNSVLNEFEAASLGLGPQRAATGLGQIAQALTKMTGPQLEIIQRMEAIRRQKGLGEEFNITPQALEGIDSEVNLYERLNNVLGEGSPIVAQYVKTLESLGKLNPTDPAAIAAAKAAGATELQQKYFGSRTAQAAFREITAPGRLQQVRTQRAAASGVEKAEEEWMVDPKTAADRVRAAYETVQTDVFNSIEKSFIRINGQLGTILIRISQGLEAGAGGQDLFSRIRYIADELVKAFTDYYNTGGKQEIQTLGYTLGNNIASFVRDFFAGSGKGAVWDAAGAFVRSFTEGIKDKLPELMAAALQSSVVKAVASFALMRAAGIGTVPSAALTTAVMQGPAAMPVVGPLISAGILATAGTVAARAMWTRQRFGGTVGPGGVRTGGMSIGDVFGAARARIDAWAPTRSARASYMGPDYISGAELRAMGITRTARGWGGTAGGRMIGNEQLYQVRPGGGYNLLGREPEVVQQRLLQVGAGATATPAAGRAATPFMRGFFQNNVIGRMPNLGRIRLGAGAATAGIFGAIGLLNAMQSEPGQRSRAAGEAIGGILGGIGGGALGAIPAIASMGLGTPLAIGGSIGGSMLGSMAGGFLGEKLAPWLEPLLGGGQPQVATQGTGMGPEQKIDLADTFALGMNGSDVVVQLEQINRKMDIRPLGNVPTTAPGGAAAGGTGQGPGLEKSFTSQEDPTSPLTKSQADAACGPAAVAFFSKAYGRTPTLKEAYDLVQSFQPSVNVEQQGSNIYAMNQAIQKFGAPPGEVHVAGETGWRGIDWGALAEGARAGRPGIVNIGKQGNFPGHFFQVGGYNPATNQFNVGPSGRVLRGGKEWMTPEEMMSFGPQLGYILGTAPTNVMAGGTGMGAPTPANTEAFIRATAPKYGIDPDVAVKAWRGEGSVVGAGQSNVYYQGKREQSFSPYQLNVEGGWGVAALAKGIDPRDPNQWQAATEFALQRVAAGGWDPGGAGLHGATAAGLQNWEGITRGTGTGMGPGGGGGISINTLIGTVILGGSATQEDANALAAMIADALEELAATGGGTVGQVRLIAP